MKIRHQLLLTHGFLVVLALSIVFINVVSFKDMESDATIVNQAGKLRMLSYSMAQISVQITAQELSDKQMELISKLRSRIDEFENILQVLSGSGGDTGSVIYHAQTAGRLENVIKEWQDVFKPAYINIADNKSIIDYGKIINNEIDSYVNDINEMVTSYSVYANGKITKALAINGGLVFVIIMVTLYSFISTNKRIRKPMNVLMQELKELSLIDDVVSNKLRNFSKDELTEITRYFNEMMFDQLTKAFNRRAGLAKLSRMLQYDNRRNLKRLSLCFVDINGLKDVNDQLGHKFGDELIFSIAECIRQEIREEDFIIRMGGDEFLVVLNGIDRQSAEKVWERIKRRYELINEHGQRRYVISVSHGIADTGSYERPDVELLIKNADDRMYDEKKYIKDELRVRIIRN